MFLDTSKYYWKIKFWDHNGDEGGWSSVSSFQMGISSTTPTELKTNNSINNEDIVVDTPFFSSVYNDFDSTDEAEYYRVQVATTPDNNWGGIVWDSGKILLDAQITEGQRSEDIAYAGDDLRLDGTQYYWRIKFWNTDEEEGDWSVDKDFFRSPVEYGAKVDNGNNLKYEYIANKYWRVTGKNGTIYKFGGESGYDAQQNNPDIFSSEDISKWMLEEVRDKNGNFVKYDYYKDNGQIYPSKITYTGHDDIDGDYEIEFLREARTDNVNDFSNGFEVQNNYRISEIVAKFNGEWVKKYELEYLVGDNDNRTMLDAIRIMGRDELGNINTMPYTNFSYQEKSEGWTRDDNYSVPTYFSYESEDRGVRLADVNGDGLKDIIHANKWGMYSNEETYKVYINDGDGTGWTEDTNYSIPEYFSYDGADKGVRLADVDNDGLVDIIRAYKYDGYNFVYKVYINDGDGTGWTEDTNYSIPLYFSDEGYDKGVRLTDVNGDGLVDFIRGYNYAGNSSRSVYVNKGDGTGWEYAANYIVPLDFTRNGSADAGVRLTDVNGDGLVDFIKGYNYAGNSSRSVYLNKGDGTGWEYDENYIVPLDFILYGNMEAGVRLVDINGDGLVDFVKAFRYDNSYTYKVYTNDGDGTGWTEDASYSIPVYFSNDGSDRGTRLVDINGDGLVDIIKGYKYGYQYDDEIYEVYIADGEKSDLLKEVKGSGGATTKVIYKGSAEYKDSSDNLLNNGIPFSVQTLYSKTIGDGLGNYSTTTYEYSGGEYYYNNPYDKKFAGYEKIKTTDALGNVTTNYFHQGNDSDSIRGEYLDDISKLGKIYRTEVYDNDNDLYAKSINKWENVDLGNDRDFVKMVQSIDFGYDGDTDHRDKANSYYFNDNNGNLIQNINWGEVSGNDNGSFSDYDMDLASTTYEYAASTTLNMHLLSREYTEDNGGFKAAEKKYYYDNLGFGNVEKGNLTKEEYWVEDNDYIDIERTYNDYGLVTQEKDPRDKATNFVYDSYNLYVTTTTNPLNQSQEFYYDYSSGKVKKTIDANGNIFETVYDGLDRVVEEKQPDLDSAGLVTGAGYVYDDTSAVRSVTKSAYLDASNIVDSYTYLDGLDRPIQTRVEGENSYVVKDIEYNKLGQVKQESLPYFSSGTLMTVATTTEALFSVNAYDALGRIVSMVNSVGTTSYAYDDWKTSITDAEGGRKDLFNDVYGNLIRVDEHNDVSTYVTEYDYDLLGNLLSIEDALDNERGFEYDALGRLIRSEDLHAQADVTYGSSTFAYDDSGNITRKTDAKNQMVDYTYDDLNRVLTEDYAGQAGVEEEYAYDSCGDGIGRLCISTSTGAISNYDYNKLGLVDTETKNINSTDYSTSFDYDRQGNSTLITYPDNTEVKYAYNNAGLFESVEKKESGDATYIDLVSDFDYNPMTAILEKNYVNGVDTVSTYDADNLYRLSGRGTLNASSTNFQDLSYIYDKVGNISRITDASDTNTAKIVDYGYDDLYRLTRASTTDATTLDYFRTYAYNAIGNITNKSDIGAYSYTDNGYNNPHAVTSVAGDSYAYDNNGNLTSDSTWTHAWDYRNRLTNSSDGSANISYTYDSDVNRVSLSDGDITTYYPNKFYNITSTGTTTKHIYAGSELIATIDSDHGIQYAHTDHLGGSSVITDEDGEVVQVLDYYPYGDLRLNEKVSGFDEKRKFTGHEYDDETELSYMVARYQDGGTGKFISVDPVFNDLGLNKYKFKDKYNKNIYEVLTDPQQLNSYSYARNNPLIYTDPTGETPFHLAVFAAMAVFETACTIYDAANLVYTYLDSNSTSIDRENAKDFLGIGLMTVGSGKMADDLFDIGKSVSKIGISNKKMQHVIDRHTLGGKKFKSGNTSYFNEGVDIKGLIKDATQQKTSINNDGFYEYSYDAGKNIGVDRATGNQTSTMTVIADKNNNLVTAHPGSPGKPHK